MMSLEFSIMKATMDFTQASFTFLSSGKYQLPRKANVSCLTDDFALLFQAGRVKAFSSPTSPPPASAGFFYSGSQPLLVWLPRG